jgi:replicative DNA helicase
MERRERRDKGFTWGTESRDMTLPLLRKGQYNVLVGETGGGKTEISFYIARENCKKGRSILYVSLEMTTQALIERYARKKAGVTKKEEYDEKIPEHKINKVAQIIDSIPNNLEFFGGANVSIQKIHEKLKARKYDMVFIDNFGFIAEHSKDTEKFEKISRDLVEMKKKNDCCIVVMHHFRKGSSGDRGMFDLRGSGKIADDVDIIVHYERPNPDTCTTNAQKCQSRIKILKDRENGEYSTHDLYFQNGTFTDSYAL